MCLQLNPYALLKQFPLLGQSPLIVSTDVRFKLNSKLVLELDTQVLKAEVQFLLVFLLQGVVIEGGGWRH